MQYYFHRDGFQDYCVGSVHYKPVLIVRLSAVALVSVPDYLYFDQQELLDGFCLRRIDLSPIEA